MSRSLFAALLLGAFTFSAAALSPISAHAAFNAAQKKELNEIIAKFIQENPEALISSVEAHYNKQAESQQAQTGTLDEIPENMEDNLTPAFGPKDAKVTVIQFFDYNCGYCKQVATDFSRLMESDKTIRVVFKELPILSESSETAARYALAAHKQGKYVEFHESLMNYRGSMTEAVMKSTAETLKLDVKKLERDANSQDIRDALSRNLDLARQLGVRGTPFFLFNTEKVPGAIGFTRMKEIIDAQSGNTSATTSSNTAPAPAAAQDPVVQAEINKAQQEAADMVRELREEAAKIREAAEKQLEEAKRLQAIEEAKTAKEAADKK